VTIERERQATADEAPMPFVCEAEEIGDVLHVRFRGELDIAVADECRTTLEEPLAPSGRIVVLDVGGLRFMDTTGLRVLMDIHNTLDTRGGSLLIERVSRPVRRLLDVAGMSSYFQFLDGGEPVTCCPACETILSVDDAPCPSCGEF
jgi:anti-anti-sigma factor